VAVAGEELIYRLAAVILFGALCARIAGRGVSSLTCPASSSSSWSVIPSVRKACISAVA